MGRNSVSGGHFWPKKHDEILVSNSYRSQNGSKDRPRGLKNISCTYFHHFYYFWDVQKFLRFWAYFWKFGLVGQKFSKIVNLQKSQKTSFFNICCFFVAFWAKWAKLPTFTQFCLPEISRGLGGYPMKIGILASNALTST